MHDVVSMPIKDIENVKTTQRHQHRFSGLFVDNFTQRTLPDTFLPIFGIIFLFW